MEPLYRKRKEFSRKEPRGGCGLFTAGMPGCPKRRDGAEEEFVRPRYGDRPDGLNGHPPSLDARLERGLPEISPKTQAMHGILGASAALQSVSCTRRVQTSGCEPPSRPCSFSSNPGDGEAAGISAFGLVRLLESEVPRGGRIDLFEQYVPISESGFGLADPLTCHAGGRSSDTRFASRQLHDFSEFCIDCWFLPEGFSHEHFAGLGRPDGLDVRPTEVAHDRGVRSVVVNVPPEAGGPTIDNDPAPALSFAGSQMQAGFYSLGRHFNSRTNTVVMCPLEVNTTNTRVSEISVKAAPDDSKTAYERLFVENGPDAGMSSILDVFQTGIRTESYFYYMTSFGKATAPMEIFRFAFTLN